MRVIRFYTRGFVFFFWSVLRNLVCIFSVLVLFVRLSVAVVGRIEKLCVLGFFVGLRAVFYVFFRVVRGWEGFLGVVGLVGVLGFLRFSCVILVKSFYLLGFSLFIC